MEEERKRGESRLEEEGICPCHPSPPSYHLPKSHPLTLGYAPDAPSTFEKKEQLVMDVGKWRSGKGTLFFHPFSQTHPRREGGG